MAFGGAMVLAGSGMVLAVLCGMWGGSRPVTFWGGLAAAILGVLVLLVEFAWDRLPRWLRRLSNAGAPPYHPWDGGGWVMVIGLEAVAALAGLGWFALLPLGDPGMASEPGGMEPILLAGLWLVVGGSGGMALARLAFRTGLLHSTRAAILLGLAVLATCGLLAVGYFLLLGMPALPPRTAGRAAWIGLLGVPPWAYLHGVGWWLLLGEIRAKAGGGHGS